jgi:hypothetical protein
LDRFGITAPSPRLYTFAIFKGFEFVELRFSKRNPKPETRNPISRVRYRCPSRFSQPGLKSGK